MQQLQDMAPAPGMKLFPVSLPMKTLAVLLALWWFLV